MGGCISSLAMLLRCCAMVKGVALCLGQEGKRLQCKGESLLALKPGCESACASRHRCASREVKHNVTGGLQLEVQNGGLGDK